MRSTFLIALLASAAMPGAAFAQNAAAQIGNQSQPQAPEALRDNTVGEIVVTADKTAKTVQRTSIAVSVVSGAEIQKEGRSKLDDVLVNQPSVVVQGAARGMLVSIRGLGLNLPPQNGAGAVANNYDGVYSSRSESASAGFYDLDRVEVLRGPQSTIYGRNAVGGVLNVISRDPVLGRFGGYVQGEYGNYDNLRGEGALNVPIGSMVALRVAGAGVRRDGYISNGRDDNKASSFRAKLLIEPNDRINLLAGFEHTLLGGKGPGAIPIASYDAGNRKASDPPDGYQHSINNKYWAQLKADIGPGQLFILPSYQRTRGIVQGAFGGNYANNYDPLYTDQFAVEARYSSRPGSPVQWNFGYYHYNNKGASLGISGSCVLNGTVIVPAPGFSNVANGPPGACQADTYATEYSPDVRTIDSDAVFGQVTIPVSAALRAVVGGRHTWEQAGGTTDLNSGNTAGAGGGVPSTTTDIRTLTTIKSRYFDYRLGVEYDVAPASLFYATVASGHRQAGYGFAGPGTAPGSYDTESMTDYELGLKNKFADGKLLLNLSAFYYDYRRYQLVEANFFSTPPVINIFTPPAHEYGFEAEAALALSSVDKLTGSAVYLKSRIRNDGSPAGIVYGGEEFPNTPHWQFKAGYSHEFQLGSAGRITARGDFRSLSSQLVFPRQNIDSPAQFAESTQKSYVSGDAILGWTSDNGSLSATAFLKNINNKLIKQSDYFGFVQLQAPRTYGVTAGVKF